MLKQIYTVLVIHELYLSPLDIFLLVLLLLHGEHVLVELLLQLLIGVVDAQLLETVLLEDLEAKDIQQPDELQPVVVLCLHLL